MAWAWAMTVPPVVIDPCAPPLIDCAMQHPTPGCGVRWGSGTGLAHEDRKPNEISGLLRLGYSARTVEGRWIPQRGGRQGSEARKERTRWFATWFPPFPSVLDYSNTVFCNL